MSCDLMAAEAQLDAMLATGLTPGAADLARLRDFLRDCGMQAAALESPEAPPVVLSHCAATAR